MEYPVVPSVITITSIAVWAIKTMKSASEKASSMTASTDDAENDVDNDLKMVFGETTPLLSPKGEEGASPSGRSGRGLVHAERHSPDARGQDSAAPHHLRQPRRPVEHADVQQ